MNNPTESNPNPEPSRKPPRGKTPLNSHDYVLQIKETADKLLQDHASRGDLKLLSNALKELRYCLKVFRAYRGYRKATVFGSARTPPTHPAYAAAVDYGKKMAEAGWMVITGAASGIMEAGHVGAGREASIGLNILLPFEQGANRIIRNDPKLMNLRYFFTRKLMFIKESDAVVLFPGGFGTHDEAFEALTLIQTGKSHMFPIIMVDQPGGTYWQQWLGFIKEGLLYEGYISEEDLSLFTLTDSVAEAVEIGRRFYRNYHSMRFVRNDLVLRLNKPIPDSVVAELNQNFSDILEKGRIEQTEMLPGELNEPELAQLPRLRFRFNRRNYGRLRQMIDRVNET